MGIGRARGRWRRGGEFDVAFFALCGALQFVMGAVGMNVDCL